MNPFYDIIEDTITEALEREETFWLLPDDFEISIPDDAFQAMLKAGLMYSAGTVVGQSVPKDTKCITLQILEHRVTVRSDEDPDRWLPILRSDAIH